MPDTAKIIEAVNGIHESMDVGFATIHTKIDQHNKRLTNVETVIAVKKALCKKKKEEEAVKRDYWLPVIRIASAAGLTALLVIAGKLLIFGLKL